MIYVEGMQDALNAINELRESRNELLILIHDLERAGGDAQPERQLVADYDKKIDEGFAYIRSLHFTGTE